VEVDRSAWRPSPSARGLFRQLVEELPGLLDAEALPRLSTGLGPVGGPVV
jgi:hypothetical protein